MNTVATAPPEALDAFRERLRGGKVAVLMTANFQIAMFRYARMHTEGRESYKFDFAKFKQFLTSVPDAQLYHLAYFTSSRVMKGTEPAPEERLFHTLRKLGYHLVYKAIETNRSVGGEQPSNRLPRLSVELTLRAEELLDTCDTFVILDTNPDMTSLITHLREQGAKVLAGDLSRIPNFMPPSIAQAADASVDFSDKGLLDYFEYKG